MTLWFRDRYPADDVWLYYEIDDERFVRRHVAMEGPELEWSFAQVDRENPEPITQAEFESIWEHARQARESRNYSV